MISLLVSLLFQSIWRCHLVPFLFFASSTRPRQSCSTSHFRCSNAGVIWHRNSKICTVTLSTTNTLKTNGQSFWAGGVCFLCNLACLSSKLRTLCSPGTTVSASTRTATSRSSRCVRRWNTDSFERNMDITTTTITQSISNKKDCTKTWSMKCPMCLGLTSSGHVSQQSCRNFWWPCVYEFRLLGDCRTVTIGVQLGRFGITLLVQTRMECWLSNLVLRNWLRNTSGQSQP